MHHYSGEMVFTLLAGTLFLRTQLIYAQYKPKCPGHRDWIAFRFSRSTKKPDSQHAGKSTPTLLESGGELD